MVLRLDSRHFCASRVWSVLGAAVVAASTLSSCASSGGTAQPVNNPSASASTSQCVKDATAAVATYKKPLPLKLAGTSVDMSKLSGKTFWFISPTQATGYAAAVTKAFAAAGKAAGVKTHLFNGNAQPDLYNQGVDQAVAAKAAGIVLYAINPALVPNALAKAKAAGIPVLGDATGVPTPTDGTLAGTVTVDLRAEGTQMANYALMTAGCKINAAVAYDPNLKALTTQLGAIKATFAKACPSTCKVTDLSLNIATMATKLQTQTASLLLRDSSINMAIATFDSAATYMAPAVAKANIKLIGTNGLPANLTMIRTTGVQVADVSYPPAEYNGWILVDQLARAALKQPVDQTQLPLQLFDKSNIPSSNDFNTLWPNLVGYQLKFTALWGR